MNRNKRKSNNKNRKGDKNYKPKNKFKEDYVKDLDMTVHYLPDLEIIDTCKIQTQPI